MANSSFKAGGLYVKFDSSIAFGCDEDCRAAIQRRSIQRRLFGPKENLNEPPTLDEILGPYIPLIEDALDAASSIEPGCPEKLGQAIRYSLLAPGKRLRPCLVLMAAEAAGGPVESAMAAAVAVEMVHAYSLIHDDLPAMDDDDLRRGRPTCHIQFDEATAILAGDALLARAFEVLADGMPDSKIRRAIKVLGLAAGPTALVGGQADDLSEHDQQQDQQQLVQRLESIHLRKTGALFAASIELGGLSVGAEPPVLQALSVYAEKIGLTFQIVDDLLDFLGSSEEVGKRTGKDIQLGKLTFPGLLGVESSRQRAEQLTAAAIESLTLLGTSGRRLQQLAQFVLQRSR